MPEAAPLIQRERRVKRVRVSVSLPEDILEWLKWRAREVDGTSVSGLIKDGALLLHEQWEQSTERTPDQ